jgi:hypothetical protein
MLHADTRQTIFAVIALKVVYLSNQILASPAKFLKIGFFSFLGCTYGSGVSSFVIFISIQFSKFKTNDNPEHLNLRYRKLTIGFLIRAVPCRAYSDLDAKGEESASGAVHVEAELGGRPRQVGRGHGGEDDEEQVSASGFSQIRKCGDDGEGQGEKNS